MNVLFLTLGAFPSIEVSSLYPDLLRCFRNNGHEIYVIAPCDSSNNLVVQEKNCTILHINTGSAKASSNLIKKGLAQLSIGITYKNHLEKYFGNVKFDLILYSTPPITLCGVVNYIKQRDNAKAYLILKDIFPQNAVDLGMMKNNGIKGLLYRFFRNKEKRLYAISDKIGCMSQANVDYLLTHNYEINPKKVEVCPNCIDIRDVSLTAPEKAAMRKKYDIPEDKLVFVYGGNLGKPQNIPFIIDCLKSQSKKNDRFFLIIGSGTAYTQLERYCAESQQENVRLMSALPIDEYSSLLAACDIGMIFLDSRFTIPNFPSRLLNYMQASLPVLACTDTATDIGRVITEGGFGSWCQSNSVDAFCSLTDWFLSSDLSDMSKNGRKYLIEHYSVKQGYEIIMNSLNTAKRIY